MRTARRVGIGLVVLFAVAWLALYAREWVFRKRAERLLADVRSLQLNRSTFDDVQGLIKRWGKHSGTEDYEGCSPALCTYWVQVDDILPQSSFVSQYESWNLVPRLADHLGLHSAWAWTQIVVEDGVVISKWYVFSVDVPRSEWFRGKVYWPSLSAGSREAPRLRTSFRDSRSWHPNRDLWEPRGTLQLEYTPQEDAETVRALTDIRFDCVTRLRPCHNREEVVPNGEREFQAERTAHADGNLRPPCFPLVRSRARDATEIFAGTVLGLPSAGLIKVQVEATLKGSPSRGLGETLPVNLLGDAKAVQPDLLRPGARVLLLQADPSFRNSKTPLFRVDGCGVVSASAENLEQAREGAADDFRHGQW